MKCNHKKGILTLVFLPCLIFFYPLPSDGTSLQEINKRLRECIDFAASPSCGEALVLLEALQTKAVAEKNFSCQTNVLGLEAEIIMLGLDPNDRAGSFPLMKKVNELCSQF